MRGRVKIFISYRRAHGSWEAHSVHQHLVNEFGAENVFMDVDNMEPGEDFVDRLEAEVARCDVAIAVIDKLWLDARDEQGKRRLESDSDFVRIELAAALRRGIRVIPVLVSGATVPKVSELPSDLAKLVRRQAVTLTPERVRHEISPLIDVIRKDGQRRTASHTASAETSATEHHAGQTRAPAAVEPKPAQPPPILPATLSSAGVEVRTGSVATEAPVAASGVDPRRGRSWLVVGLAAVAGLGGWLALRSGPTEEEATEPAPTSQAPVMQVAPPPNARAVATPPSTELPGASAEAKPEASAPPEVSSPPSEEPPLEARPPSPSPKPARQPPGPAKPGLSRAACATASDCAAQANDASTAKRHVEAAELFVRACQQADAVSCWRVGYMYEVGTGVKQDAREAVRLYRNSCDGGSADGCAFLASMYRWGEGVKADVKEAVRLDRKACDNGSMLGCNFLAAMYKDGDGVKKDLQEALRLYKKVCEGGDAQACEELRSLQTTAK